MIEISEAEYKSLKKNADDNRQIRNIVLIVLIFLSLGFITAFWINPLIQNELEKSRAETNKQVRLIEQGDLTDEEYFKWLEVRND